MFLIYAVAVVAAIVMTVFLIEKLPAALHDMNEDTKALLTSEKNSQNTETTSQSSSEMSADKKVPKLLTVVNSKHKFGNRDSGLVNIYDYKTRSYLVKSVDLKVDKRVMKPLNEMMDEFFKATGKSDVNIISGYRSVGSQDELYKSMEKTHGKKYAKHYCQIPGGSEHHTGLAIDLSIYDVNTGKTTDFKGQDEYSWFYENSWKYGFIRRYEEEKESITGIAYEPWHFRYVGKKAAEEMFKSGKCLEEYTGKM